MPQFTSEGHSSRHSAAGEEAAGRTADELAGAARGTANQSAAGGRIAQAPAVVDNRPGRTAAADTLAAHTVAGRAAAEDTLGCIRPASVGPHETIRRS